MGLMVNVAMNIDLLCEVTKSMRFIEQFLPRKISATQTPAYEKHIAKLLTNRAIWTGTKHCAFLRKQCQT